VTAGTLFDRRRTPLTVWFQACWEFASAKDGISAQALARNLEMGSYATAWAMLHRLRSVLVRPGRELLNGIVEVDETYIGGVEPGLKGGRQKGKKSLVVVAVEVGDERGMGRARMQAVPDATGATLRKFITETVEPGARIITDGLPSYARISEDGYTHDPRNQKAAKAAGEDLDSILPGVHRVAALVKRWLLSTHEGAVSPEHLPAYLDEFVFRFNRRRSRSRGLLFYRLLQLAVDHDPVRYTDLVANPASKEEAPQPPGTAGHPPSLDRPRAARPWRNTTHSGPVN